MVHYGVAWNKRDRDPEIHSGWAQASCGCSSFEFAEVIAENRVRDGFKDVTVFEYYDEPPYDKIMTHYISWDFIKKNKVKEYE